MPENKRDECPICGTACTIDPGLGARITVRCRDCSPRHNYVMIRAARDLLDANPERLDVRRELRARLQNEEQYGTKANPITDTDVSELIGPHVIP